MRHRKSGRKLKRTASHRKATLNALCTALLRHKKIRTTVAKAKETRMVVEKIITRAKHAASQENKAVNVHARRQVARNIKDREVVSELFGEIATKLASRPGGYTRIVKLGRRQGDDAEIAVLELVDYNTGRDEKKSAKKKKGEAAAKAKEETAAKPKAEKAAKAKVEKTGRAKKEKA